VFGNAAEAINQRKRYDQALTLFDDDKEEEHLAQKTSATPLTKKSLNVVPAAAAPSTSKKNSSTNPPEIFAAEESSSSGSSSEEEEDADEGVKSDEEVEDPSPQKKDFKSKGDDHDDGLLGASEAVPQAIGKVATNKKRGASAVTYDAAEDEATVPPKNKKVPRRKK
jgi:hypothetical protein